MGSNVFGAPITNEFLKTLPEYSNKTITQADRAKAALLQKNMQDKDTNARAFVENLKAKYPEEGTGILIYNATGDRITLVACHDFTGKLARSPYPSIIENGQWGAFLHVFSGQAASIGAVVYGGNNAEGGKSQWLLGWKQATNQPAACYTEIHKENYYSLNTNKQTWDALMAVLTPKDEAISLSQAQDYGLKAFATIGNTNSPLFEGILTFEEQV